jgi:hypothetical protein
MINTEKVIGFYTDVFGNEIDIYEEIEKYTVCYKGFLFEGDDEKRWNSRNCDKWEDAKSIYQAYADKENKMYIIDNEYGVTYQDGEWS